MTNLERPYMPQYRSHMIYRIQAKASILSISDTDSLVTVSNMSFDWRPSVIIGVRVQDLDGPLHAFYNHFLSLSQRDQVYTGAQPKLRKLHERIGQIIIASWIYINFQ